VDESNDVVEDRTTRPAPVAESSTTATVTRFALFIVVMVGVMAWVAAGNDDYSSAARFFLRQLFRQML
jgi:hypothetical protein